MIIPCIDLMGGKVVQLVRGKDKALEIDSLDEAIQMFAGFPLIHVIDLDAAKGQGNGDALVRKAIAKVSVRVGGGIRSIQRARELIDLGARQIIVGSAAYTTNGVDQKFLEELGRAVGAERVILAIDCLHGKVAVKGWESTVDLTAEQAIGQADGLCGGYLCTYVDNEGTMQGTDLELFRRLRSKTSRTLAAAGGIGSNEEVEALTEMGVDVALGMAIYTGQIQIAPPSVPD